MTPSSDDTKTGPTVKTILIALGITASIVIAIAIVITAGIFWFISNYITWDADHKAEITASYNAALIMKQHDNLKEAKDKLLQIQKTVGSRKIKDQQLKRTLMQVAHEIKEVDRLIDIKHNPKPATPAQATPQEAPAAEPPLPQPDPAEIFLQIRRQSEGLFERIEAENAREMGEETARKAAINTTVSGRAQLTSDGARPVSLRGMQIFLLHRKSDAASIRRAYNLFTAQTRPLSTAWRRKAQAHLIARKGPDETYLQNAEDCESNAKEIEFYASELINRHSSRAHPEDTREVYI